MKRLQLLDYDNNTLATEEIFCNDYDYWRGIIHTKHRPFKWEIVTSEDEVICSGECKSVKEAAKHIRQVMVDSGADIEKERRKLKI
jgi:hypothetical protein